MPLIQEILMGKKTSVTETGAKLLNWILADPIGADIRVTSRHVWLTTSRDGRSKVVAHIAAQAICWLMDSVGIAQILHSTVASIAEGRRSAGPWTLEVHSYVVWFRFKPDEIEIYLRRRGVGEPGPGSAEEIPEHGPFAFPKGL